MVELSYYTEASWPGATLYIIFSCFANSKKSTSLLEKSTLMLEKSTLKLEKSTLMLENQHFKVEKKDRSSLFCIWFHYRYL